MDGATPGKQSQPGMGSNQDTKPGGFAQAIEDFDVGAGGRPITDHGGGIRSGTLEDGSTISVRPGSSHGSPTVQINPPEWESDKDTVSTMSSQSVFSTVKDEGRSEALVRKVGQVINRASEGRFGLTRVGDWVAIPSESSSHLNRGDRNRLATAFRSRGHERIYAVALEVLKNIELAYEIEASEAGLDLFNRTCAHFNYVLCSVDVSCLAICTTDDYLVIAGRADFVEGALGKSTGEAIAAFEEFIADPGWVAPMPSLLNSVLTALRDEYSSANEGEVVGFPK